jgi:hypothetical protein
MNKCKVATISPDAKYTDIALKYYLDGNRLTALHYYHQAAAMGEAGAHFGIVTCLSDEKNYSTAIEYARDHLDQAGMASTLLGCYLASKDIEQAFNMVALLPASERFPNYAALKLLQ